MNKYNLIIDDERTLDSIVEVTGNAMYLNHEWVITRTFDDFCKIIDDMGIPNIVSFDHDIADFKDGVERSGLTCCKYLVDKCIDLNIDFPEYSVHSANPRGRDNINSYIKNYINLKLKGFFD